MDAALRTDRTVEENTVASPSGINSSDPEGGAISHFWEQTGGSAVVLSDPEAAQPIVRDVTGGLGPPARRETWPMVEM